MTNRIQSLPRRNWRDRADEARQLNALLRQPGGTQTLHDIQAVSLLEAWEREWLICYARVGAGKTRVIGLLLTLMAMKGYDRPLVCVPGSLLKKTEKHFITDRAEGWKIGHQYWLESYTALAQESRADILEERQPNMLLFDEPDGLRRSNATSRRVGRYVNERRSQGKKTFLGFFHGTPYRDAITDCSHMVNWAASDESPFPLDPIETAQWSSWLDQGDSSGRVAFTKYFDLKTESIEESEDAFRERLVSTPGIILSDDEFTDSELIVNAYNVDPGLDREFEQLRTLWEKPDGWKLLDASASDDPDEVNTWSIWGVARQLAVGFYYVADPTPPKDWMAARKAYADYVRTMIDAPNSRFDTEKQVRTACEKAFERTGKKVVEWANWTALKDSFTPRSRPIWVGTHALDAAKSWGAQGPGIVWTDHIAFGERLSAETGWAFYGQKGLDASGRSIEAEQGDRPIIASRLANQRGRNLQHAFWRNLGMAVPNAAADIEQWFGRTHRFGQRSPRVVFDIYCACSEHAKALDVKIPKGAHKAQRLFGLTQKIMSTTINVHGEVPVQSWAWR